MKKMANLRLFSSLMKGSEMSFDHESKFQWQEDAACRFQPYTLFEIADRDSPISLDLNVSEIKDLNDTNFKKAVEICNTCPVKGTCLEEATEGDLEWSVRGGLLPDRYNPNPKGRPEESTCEPEERGIKCHKGHDEWKFESKGRWRCIPCRDIANQKQRDKRKSQSKVRVAPDRVVRGVLCRYGHDDWIAVDSTGKKFRCYTCRKITNAEVWQRKRTAMLES